MGQRSSFPCWDYPAGDERKPTEQLEHLSYLWRISVSHFWTSGGPTGSGKTCAATTFGRNRRERRLQAAMMRGKRVEGHMMIGSHSAVSDEIKVDICRVVRAIQFAGLAGGTCLLRAGVGYVVLRLLGWSPRLCVGSALYRAGPSAMRDVLPFCGSGNTGQMVDGGFLGHVWLEMDDELIDFSCGDWPDLDHRGELTDSGLGPIQWDALPRPSSGQLGICLNGNLTVAHSLASCGMGHGTVPRLTTSRTPS
jgi:hypothetical protein